MWCSFFRSLREQGLEPPPATRGRTASLTRPGRRIRASILVHSHGDIGWCRNDASEKLDDCGIVPFGRSDNAADLPAGAVEDERRGQSHRADIAKRVSGGVHVDREILDADVAVETGYLRSPATGDGDRHAREFQPAQGCLQAVERGHLGPAGHAPRRPYVEDDDPSLELGEAVSASLRVGEVD